MGQRVASAAVRSDSISICRDFGSVFRQQRRDVTVVRADSPPHQLSRRGALGVRVAAAEGAAVLCPRCIAAARGALLADKLYPPRGVHQRRARERHRVQLAHDAELAPRRGHRRHGPGAAALGAERCDEAKEPVRRVESVALSRPGRACLRLGVAASEQPSTFVAAELSFGARVTELSSKMLGGASQTVSKIHVTCNGKK